jgi:photosystem II stability/assembly factor-like uncharacterized protein
VTVPAALVVLNEVVCISATTCLVTGGLISSSGVALLTTDAGHSWTVTSVPGVRWTGPVACFASESCVIEGTNALETKESMFSFDVKSQHVTPETLPSSNGVITGLACAGMPECIAVGEGQSISDPVVIATGETGTTWRKGSLPKISGLTLQAVACSTSLNCWAVGDNSAEKGESFSSSNGGVTWKQQTVAPSIAEIDYLTCPSASWCLGEGFNASFKNEFVDLSI